MPGHPNAEELKREAAAEALKHVRSDMVLGLGTGSTVAHLLDQLGEALAGGALSGIVGVPTSTRTEGHARQLGIPLRGLGEGPPPDLTIDGADEVGPTLDLIKGMGGALLREKMVAQASDQVVIIADESKVVQTLGTLSPLPVEVVEWGMVSHVGFLEALGASATLRCRDDGEPVRSDNGNLFLDCRFTAGLNDPESVERALAMRAGIVETGLFLGIATAAIIASPEGVRTMESPR